MYTIDASMPDIFDQTAILSDRSAPGDRSWHIGCGCARHIGNRNSDSTRNPTVEVLEWISNFIPHFTGLNPLPGYSRGITNYFHIKLCGVITHACLNSTTVLTMPWKI